MEAEEAIQQLAEHRTVSAIRGQTIFAMFLEGFSQTLAEARSGDPTARRGLRLFVDLMSDTETLSRIELPSGNGS